VPKDKQARRTRAANGRRTPKSIITPDQRLHYIEVSAFYIAERRGFVEGDPTADWLAAESEIDRLLREGRLGQSDDDPRVSASVRPAPATRYTVLWGHFPWGASSGQ